MDLLQIAIGFVGNPSLVVWGVLGGIGAMAAVLMKASHPFDYVSRENIQMATGLVVMVFILLPFMIDGARFPRWAKTLEGGLFAFWKELGALLLSWVLVCGLPLAAGYTVAASVRRLLGKAASKSGNG